MSWTPDDWRFWRAGNLVFGGATLLWLGFFALIALLNFCDVPP